MLLLFEAGSNYRENDLFILKGCVDLQKNTHLLKTIQIFFFEKVYGFIKFEFDWKFFFLPLGHVIFNDLVGLFQA